VLFNELLSYRLTSEEKDFFELIRKFKERVLMMIEETKANPTPYMEIMN
jgi:hypothetical protein